MRDLPSFDEITELEQVDYRKSDLLEHTRLMETGNWVPYSHKDQSPYAYTNVQFNWGRRV